MEKIPTLTKSLRQLETPWGGGGYQILWARILHNRDNHLQLL